MSRTSEARETYKELREFYKFYPNQWYILGPGLYKYKGKWYWVSRGERAYQLKELGDTHLLNTITALRQRHPAENRKPLERELFRRKLIGRISWKSKRLRQLN